MTELGLPVLRRSVLISLAGVSMFCLMLWLRHHTPEVVALIPLADTFGGSTDRHLSPALLNTLLIRVQFLLFGLALLLMGSAAIHMLSTIPCQPWIERLKRYPVVPVLILGIFLGSHVIQQRIVQVNGTPYYLLEDDAMISMRYARNWTNGLGIVWNPGEYVEGYSNFLWVTVMAVVHALGVPEASTSAVIMFINWLLLLATLWFVQEILLTLSVRPFWIFCVTLIILLDINMVFWAVSGLETTLLTYLVVVCIYAVLYSKESLLCIGLALLPLVRTDGFVLSGLIGAGYLVCNPGRWHRIAGLMLIAAIPAVLHMVFRVTYYRELLPNTFYLKSTLVDNLPQIGLSYALRLIPDYGLLLLLFVGAGATLLHRHNTAFILIVSGQIFYMILTGGDIMWFLRFFAPVIPLLYIGTAVLLNHLAPKNDTATTRYLPSVCAAGLFCISPVVSQGMLFDVGMNAYFRNYVVAALLIEQNMPSDTHIGVMAAGITPYFAEKQPFIDTLGKADAHIAKLPAVAGNRVVGHNKVDFDYVYDSRRPAATILFGTCREIQQIAAIARDQWKGIFSSLPVDQMVAATFAILHPTFVNDYVSNPVTAEQLDSSAPLCIFLRNGSGIQTHWVLDN